MIPESLLDVEKTILEFVDEELKQAKPETRIVLKTMLQQYFESTHNLIQGLHQTVDKAVEMFSSTRKIENDRGKTF